MNIFYVSDSERRKFEGRTQISSLIKDYLHQKGYDFVDHPSKADIIHFHSSGIAASYRAFKLKKKYGVPCIYTLYSIAETNFFSHIKNYLEQKKIAPKFKGNFLLSSTAAIPIKIRCLFLRKLDRVIVASSYSKNKMPSNTQQINFGVDLSKFHPKKRKINQTIKVGFFGHPSSLKGITDYILASKQFPQNVEPYLFPSRTTKKLLKYVSKVNSKIIVKGYVEKIDSAYNEMDIIVLPYRTSIGAISNPLVMLEVMAMGIPIITTNIPSLKEIVKHSALIVKPYSPRSISIAVSYLSKNQDKMILMGEESRKIVLDNYNVKKMLDNYLRLYEEIEVSKNKKFNI